MNMDFRKTFDKIPEKFDMYRPRYCPELFEKLTSVCSINPSKKVLEIGPGTGQATEPILTTGCDYTAIELGKNFTKFMKEKFSSYNNFQIINDDFESYNFADNTYDLIFSAATIQWIPKKIAFTKTYEMLKPGGYLAMFMTCSDEYISYISTHCEHITLEEPYKSAFYSGIKNVIMEHNDKITIIDTIPLYLAQKPN